MAASEIAPELSTLIEPTKDDVIKRLQQYDAFSMLERLPALPGSRQRAAVLVPLFIRHGQLHVLLTLRSDHLRSHGGEAALPGGKREKEDVDYRETALREASEEVGLPSENVEVISHLGPIFARGRTLVIPIVGFIPEDFSPTPNPSEVQDVFSAPLSNFLKSENHFQKLWTNSFDGHSSYVHFFHHSTGEKSYTIYGLTAGILVQAAGICFDQSPTFEMGDQYDRINPFKVSELYYMRTLKQAQEELLKDKL